MNFIVNLLSSDDTAGIIAPVEMTHEDFAMVRIATKGVTCMNRAGSHLDHRHGVLGLYRAMLLLALGSPSAFADPLHPSVRLDKNVHFEGPGLGLYPSASASVGLYSVVVRELFFDDGFIDMDFLVQDRGGEAIELTFYHSRLFNASSQDWLGLQLDLGFKDEDGTFVNSTSPDALEFDAASPDQPLFLSTVFTTFSPEEGGGESLVWGGGTLTSPGNTLLLYRIIVPASNANMPAFAMRDGGYAFTLRQRPRLVEDRDPPPPAIVPEPSSFTLVMISTLVVLIARRRAVARAVGSRYSNSHAYRN